MYYIDYILICHGTLTHTRLLWITLALIAKFSSFKILGLDQKSFSCVCVQAKGKFLAYI